MGIVPCFRVLVHETGRQGPWKNEQGLAPSLTAGRINQEEEDPR